MHQLPFDPQTLPTLIEQGYIISQVHPTLPLTIYNYSAKTQYERYWNDATLTCRGLVLDAQYQPVARPLPKFFNLEEYAGTLPDGVPTIYEKLDGSLILLFFYQEQWRVASRGSFMSEQALKATALLANYQSHLATLDRHYTYLLEIIYPQNRIVVDYGAAERLVLLAAVETQTGEERDHGTVDWSDRAQTYPATSLPDWMKALDPATIRNHEGFILKWSNGFRLKYKLADYVRLHRILTRVQAKDIWECLSQNQDLEQFLDSVPDEFYSWVKSVKADLEAQYQAIEADGRARFQDLGESTEQMLRNRKTTAAYFQTQPNPKLLFLMLDGRDYSSVIWKQIKPDYQRPFRSDTDAPADETEA
jgi:T4 RnlA family RNA ligase